MTTDLSDGGVLIVGAGPTGLTLANLLHRYGVPVRLVEKRAGLSRHTKATNIMQRTQELLDSLDLAEPLQTVGGAMSRLTVSAYGTSVGPRTMHLKQTAFPDVVLCGQDAFERAAAERLGRVGIQVEFDREFVGLKQDERGCAATVRSADGQLETVRSAYVVGADGQAGATRRHTRLDFEPVRTGVAIRQVDAILTWRRSSTSRQMWLFYVDHGFAAVVPLPGGVHRILLVEPATSVPNREPTLAELQERLRSAARDASVELSDLRWASYTDLAMGIAPALIDGRVILAGDVGNPILPNGGQGMNTGIGDAFNLGWKLAAVLRRGAPIDLLTTYDTERHRLRVKLQRSQYASLKYTTLVTPKPVQAAIRRLAGPALDLGGEYKMAEAFSELTINTRSGPLTRDTLHRRGLRAGDRARDAAVVQGTDTVQLRRLLYNGAWTLLAFAGRDRDATITDVAAAAAATDAHAADVDAYVIAGAAQAESADPRVTVLYDLDGEAHRAYGIRRATVLLVRPDGYIAVRTAPHQREQLRSYLHRWLGRPAPARSTAS